ncbi:hypothetical protein GGD62_005796 [Bradyrhizobium sp. ERR14]|nr:hypothetical protein [Bradyrhizobium sp. ERR14]
MIRTEVVFRPMPLASDHVHASCRSTLKPSKAARRCCPLLETTLTALSIRQALSSALKIERWTPFLSSAFDNRRVDCLKAVWKGRRGTDNALADVSADTLRRYPSRLRTCTGIHASRNICIIVAISVGAILVVEPILTLSAVSRRANGSSPISDWRSVGLARSLRYFYERILSALNWAASSARSYSEKDLRSVGSAHSNARRRGRVDRRSTSSQI